MVLPKLLKLKLRKIEELQGYLLQQNNKTRLTDLINLRHPLVKRTQEISWDKMEAEFKKLYSEQARPSIPIRK